MDLGCQKLCVSPAQGMVPMINELTLGNFVPNAASGVKHLVGAGWLLAASLLSLIDTNLSAVIWD